LLFGGIAQFGWFWTGVMLGALWIVLLPDASSPKNTLSIMLVLLLLSGGPVFIFTRLVRGSRQLNLLALGVLTTARLMSIESTGKGGGGSGDLGSAAIMKYTFSFESTKGIEHQAHVLTDSPKAEWTKNMPDSYADLILKRAVSFPIPEPAPEEQLLYDQLNPTRMFLLADFAHNLRIDENGRIPEYRFIGAIHLLILPLLTLASHGAYLLHWLNR